MKSHNDMAAVTKMNCLLSTCQLTIQEHSIVNDIWIKNKLPKFNYRKLELSVNEPCLIKLGP
jgi:hypothetical protein